MPENPNVDPEAGSTSVYLREETMSTVSASNANNSNVSGNRKQTQSVPRVSSATLKYYDIATQLLGKAGSDLEELFIAAARDGVYERLENFLLRRGETLVSIDVKDKKTGNTPLIWAAKRGHAKIVQLLLRHSADITLRNYEGQTAVEVASPSIRSLLLESVERSTEASHHLLLQAAWQGDIKVIRRLLTQNKVLDINCQNADGFTPLMLATRDILTFEKLSTQMSRPYNPVEVVSELLSSRGDIHMMDGDGKTCLHHAAQSKAFIAQHVVSTIIAGGPNLESKDKRCFTPIHCASLTGNADCITTLLDGGSEVNSRGFAGATPLHITAYNNHERATNVLLEHGANVTLTDDRGLTPLDFAKSRKMKSKLREAWTEVINRKSTTSLGPVRAPSKEDLRASIEDLTKKRKGEVIFDVPSNPFGDGGRKETMAKSTSGLSRTWSMKELQTQRVENLLATWFPTPAGKKFNSGSKGLTRHLSLKEKANRAEDIMNRDIDNGAFTPSPYVKDGVRRLGQVRSQKPTPLPRAKSRSTERLPAISPDRISTDRSLVSPVHFDRNTRARRSFEDRRTGGRGKRIAPLSTREGSILTDDGYDRITPGPPSPTPSNRSGPRHRRSESDPRSGTPNLADIAASCEPYLNVGGRRGRSLSMSSNNVNDGLQDQPRQTPLREATLLSVCSYRSESRLSNVSPSPRMLNLGQMGLLGKSKTPVQNMPLYPNSNKILPPTPTVQKCGHHDDGVSVKGDLSPRSDDDDLDIYKGALENPYELLRNHTFFKDEFILAESRPKDPLIQSSSSGSDTLSSSNSSHVSTPRDKIVTVKTKTGPRTGKPANSCQPNKTTGAKNVSMSLNISKQKLNSKSVPTVKETDESGKDVSVLRAMAMKNAAVLASHSKSSMENKVSNKKTGGTIIIHGDVENNDASKDNEQKHVINTSVENGDQKENIESKENAKSSQVSVVKENAGNLKSAKAGDTAVKSETTKTVTSVKDVKGKTVSKASQPLQVVPTKLTANAIKSVPKSSVDKIDEKSKNIKSEMDISKNLTTNIDVNKVENKTISNVKMELSPAAQVVSRVKTSEKETKTANKVIESNSSVQNANSDNNNDQPVGQTQDRNTGDKSKVVTSGISDNGVSNAKTEQESLPTNITKQSSSAQPANRQANTQPRNPNFSVSRSAGAYQRAAAGSRKSTPNFTPKFSSVNVKKSVTEVKVSDSSNVNKGAKAMAKSVPEKTVPVTNSVSKTETESETVNHGDQNDEKSKKPSSPSEINLAPGVCKSSSMLKSYNMAPSSNGGSKTASQPRTPRSNTRLSSNSKDLPGVSQVTVNTQNNSDKIKENKTIVQSHSATNLNYSGNTASVSITNKNVSQMPQTNTNKIQSSSAGLSRSMSMSLIEESSETSGEKKKMSSSDTKIQNHVPNSSAKQRPLSDGSVAMNGNNAVTDKILKSNGKTPLIDILPSSSPRITKTSFLEPTAKMSTPVIVNPFEELEKKREKENQLKLGARGITATEYGFVVEKPGPERSKTQTSLKSRNLKSGKKPGYGKETKPSSASTRGSSGRSTKRAKSKDSKSDDGRPKSGKGARRVRSGKRKRKIPGDNLSKQNEKSDVALIGGIGWHVATSCIDKSEADAVVVSQIDSSDYSEDEVEIVRVSPLPLDNPYALNVPNPLEISSAVSSPRFMEVKAPHVEKPALPVMANDGYPPMNLDMTQSSNSQSNIETEKVHEPSTEVPDDITALLAKLKAQENAENDTEENNDDATSSTYQQLTSAIHREILKGKLTPIPESPNITRTQSSLQHIAKTVEAISKFDENLKEEELNKMLGATPREKYGSHSGKAQTIGKQEFQCGTISKTTASLPKRPPPPKISSAGKPAQSNKGMSQLTSDSIRASSRSNSSKSKQTSNRQTPVSSADRNERIKPSPASSAGQNSRVVTPKQPLSISFNSNIINEIQSNAMLETTGLGEKDIASKTKETIERDIKIENKERKSSATSSSSDGKGESVKLDLKTLLTEKMQSTKKMLEETTNSLKSRSWRNKRKISVEDTENITAKLTESQGFDVKINDELGKDSNESGINTSRESSEIKTSRSSRKERKFSETKTSIPDDENIDVVINEILSSTYPSTKSKSTKSANSTLTEADRHLLKQMANNKEASPFYAKEHVRESSSYDDSVTLNNDNPHLMKRFHADKLQLGQKVKAMIDAGADKTRVKAMLDVDNEAKQLAKIMNSFRQMELYAGPHGGISNRSTRKETPRKGDSLSRLDQNPGSLMLSNRPAGRPGSAGAGKIKPGRFTEIKQGSTSMIAQERPLSPLAVPQCRTRSDGFFRSHLIRIDSHSRLDKNLAAEIKRSPFVEIDHDDSLPSQHLEELARAMRADSVDTEMYEGERAESACTTLSSSSAFEETIQWKKGNVLGKGAFGTVWCGLTSEGSLIAVKQIELNTNNHTKAKREYEKVQEEVELLKTLEHKNIVGYMGTSLEDSIVSIFMQFVPGGSIASILARFGALDEAVFRRYTRQILEGVEYLHQNDVIHRDIKGGNVMLMPNGVIKLIDFGCAKRLCINLSMGQSEILKSMKGTPYWMAPEVVNETGHGKKSDIWSIGCTVFEMATRKPPWADMNPMAAIFAIGSDKPVPQLPDKFSAEAKEFVNCCLIRDQTKRLSAQELLQSPFIKRRLKKS